MTNHSYVGIISMEVKMNIYEVNKLLSSEIKSKLITHFWDCKCASHDVSNLVIKFNTTQSNLSKHINRLKEEKVLDCLAKGKERYYKINQKWKQEWKDIVEPQINLKINKSFKCTCPKSGGHCEI